MGIRLKPRPRNADAGELDSALISSKKHRSGRREPRIESPLLATRRQALRWLLGSWRIRLLAGFLVVALAAGSVGLLSGDPLDSLANAWDQVYSTLTGKKSKEAAAKEEEAAAAKRALDAATDLAAAATNRLIEAAEHGRTTLNDTEGKVTDDSLRVKLSTALEFADTILDKTLNTKSAADLELAAKERNDGALAIEDATVKVTESKTAWDAAQAQAAADAAAAAKAEADAKAQAEADAKAQAAADALARAEAAQRAAEEAAARARADQKAAEDAAAKAAQRPQQGAKQPTAPKVATATSTVSCASQATVTFSASGGGIVSLNVSGSASGSTSGDGGASLQVGVPPGGSVTASASASGNVRISSSWIGTCS